MRGPECHFDEGCGWNSACAPALEEARAIPCLTREFTGFWIRATALPPPNSSGPLVGELEHCLFATVEAETAIVWSGVARRAEDSRPYRVVAVVHDYDLDPI